MTRRSALAATLAAALVVSGAGRASAQEIDTAQDEDSHGWPRSIDAGGFRLTLYQPQLEAWTDLELRARAAVSVETPGAEPALGTVWFTARTEIDKTLGTVWLDSFVFSRATFPTATDSADAWLALLKEHVSELRVLDLERFTAAVASAAPASVTRAAVRDEPPRIFFEKGLAVLVELDGPPAFRPVARSELFRAINTRSLLLRGGREQHLFLAVSDRWLEAPKLEGPWVLRAQAPEGADEVKRALVFTKKVDLHDENPEVPRILSRNEAPTVLVSTEAAVVLETAPEPELVPIPGTRLSRASDVTGDLILDPASNELYLLLGGRWFRAPSREGPWSFVPPTELPDEFAKIPATDPVGEVRVSVPGTPESEEARLQAWLPETATVRRDATFTVDYDGDPTFEAIPETPLRSCANSATPVIQAGTSFYACERGVWFEAPVALGPWHVADSIPVEIRAIPASSPLHFVSYVRVYGVHEDAVVFGYTPGYLGACLTESGLVVWGTGYAHRGWVGKSWIPHPTTLVPVRRTFARTTFTRTTFAERMRVRLYDRWQAGVVRDRAKATLQGRGSQPSPGRPVAGARATPRATRLDLYSTAEGAVFRRAREGWEAHDGAAWGKPGVAQATLESTLESERRIRQVGSERAHRAAVAASSKTASSKATTPTSGAGRH